MKLRPLWFAWPFLASLPTSAQRPDGPPPMGGPGPMMEPHQEIQKRFDADANGILEGDEVQSALAYLKEQGGDRRRGWGPGARPGPPPQGRGGPGGPEDSQERPAPGTGESLSPSDTQYLLGSDLYDSDLLSTLFLEFESPTWESEMVAFKPTDVETPALLTRDGQVIGRVGARFRGASSFMRTRDGEKRSLNLSISAFDDSLRLDGYRTLNLLNAAGDPGYLSAPLYSFIARHYLPAPKVNYLRVAIQGENRGIYINQQQFNKDFTQDFFSSSKGRRWHVPGSPNGQGSLRFLGEDKSAYEGIYEIKTKDEPEAWQALVKLTRTLDQTPLESLKTELPKVLDVDGALAFLAVENVLMNSDGYWTRASDYSLYQDEKGIFHIVPHDMNEAFRADHGPGGPRESTSQETPFNLDPWVAAENPDRPLISRLLAVPEWRERYGQLVREIASKWLDWKNLEPIARRHQDLIREEVAKDPRKLDSTEAFDQSLAELKAFADGRRSFLLHHPTLTASTAAK